MSDKTVGTAAPARIVVINHKAANIHSVDKALNRVGADAVVSSSVADLLAADGAVLPGVGAIDAAMRALEELDLIAPIIDFAASGRPLFGVCLGMQLLFERSDEGSRPGLGLIPGDVRRMEAVANGQARKIPHMGWNSVDFKQDSPNRHPVFGDAVSGSHFYFVHGYECVPTDEGDIEGTTDYGTEICAAVSRGNIVGTQFHPEKSQDFGLQLYENFTDYVTKTMAESVGR